MYYDSMRGFLCSVGVARHCSVLGDKRVRTWLLKRPDNTRQTKTSQLSYYFSRLRLPKLRLPCRCRKVTSSRGLLKPDVWNVYLQAAAHLRLPGGLFSFFSAANLTPSTLPRATKGPTTCLSWLGSYSQSVFTSIHTRTTLAVDNLVP
jgi:hypothetical protein